MRKWPSLPTPSPRLELEAALISLVIDNESGDILAVRVELPTGAVLLCDDEGIYVEGDEFTVLPWNVISENLPHPRRLEA